jgi:hypothetical protein
MVRRFVQFLGYFALQSMGTGTVWEYARIPENYRDYELQEKRRKYTN